MALSIRSPSNPTRAMIAEPLRKTLEATGYLLEGHHTAPGLSLAGAPSPPRARLLAPDAWWRSGSSRRISHGTDATSVTVLFKFSDTSHDPVAEWQRDVWNLGFAPLLWVVSQDRIDLYNGFGKPRPPGQERRNLLKSFGHGPAELRELNSVAGRLAMETGQFWRWSNKVNRRTGVGSQLLAHLGAVERDLVKNGLSHLEAQGLIGRTVFTKYLLDRHVVGAPALRAVCGYDDLPEVLEDRDATQLLFDWLRETFNGDMFPDTLRVPDARHLSRVAGFLRADDPAGQLSLFPYRFNVIPVELISSIYERFVHSSVTPGRRAPRRRARKRGVYYTPLTAVSLVLGEVFNGLAGDETVIDLTCGSGVFLVEALRRLVRLKANGSEPTREMVRRTLYEQIYGVDVSESAVQVAAFSLYLAALEVDPDPSDPESLRFEPLVGNTLLAGDAHDIEDTVDGRRVLTRAGDLKRFDVVVGNPPWTYQGHTETVARRERAPDAPRSPRGVSLDFVRRAGDFAHPGTRFGMLLSARPFFARSGTGLRAAQNAIESLGSVVLVNLSDLSHWLFEKANMPAMAVLTRHGEDPPGSMELVQVRRSPEGDRSHTIRIASSDVARLPIDSWKRNQELLKAAFLGGEHDLLLLDSLLSRYPSLEETLGTLGTGWASGLTIGDESRDATFLEGLRFASTGSIDRFHVPRDLPAWEAASAQWPRDRAIYRAPLLLVNQNMLQEHSPILAGRLIAAVAPQDIVYQEAYHGVSFADVHPDIAYLLTGILSSSFASWHALMTASNFGMWKRSVRVADVEKLPAPDLQTAMRTDAGRRVTGLVRRFHERSPAAEDWLALDEAVFNLYKLDQEERTVANDGRLRATWQWRRGRVAAAKAAEPRQLEEYASAFLLSMDAWLDAANERRFRAEIYDTGPASALRVVRFVLEDQPPPSHTVVRRGMSLRELLDNIDDRLGTSIAAELVGSRELRVHARREVVIVKPAARRFWLGVAGLDDARAVLAKSFARGSE